MSVIDTLITNRTAADVSRALTLQSKGWNGMDDEEREEWITGERFTYHPTAAEQKDKFAELRGAYNFTDWNRVESAVRYLGDALIALPDELRAYCEAHGVAWDAFFDSPYPKDLTYTTKTDWALGDDPNREQMERYLANVVSLASVTFNFHYSQWGFYSMDGLTADRANRIEEALIRSDESITATREQKKQYIDSTEASFRYSGEVFAGEI